MIHVDFIHLIMDKYFHKLNSNLKHL